MATAVTVEELQARLAEIQERQRELDSEYAGQAFPEEQKAEFERLQEEKKETDRTIAQLETRKAWIEENSHKPTAVEQGATFHTPRSVSGEDVYDLSTIRASYANPAEAGREMKDRARKVIEMARFKHPDVKPEETKTHVERLLETDSEDGRFARYLIAISSPAYKRAFGRALAGGMLSRDEQAAMELATTSYRALSLTGASGGFAVPFELDPTILGTSNGTVNPIRDIARVESMTVDEWRGITSAGITAAYEAEATEVADNTPTLAQPTVSAEKAHAFVPFSIEVGQDWGGLQEQMALLLQEAKDDLEASKFATGTGANEPFGVVTGTTNTVNAAAGQTFTLANLYALIAALPPRYRARASFVGDLQILNRIRQFDTVGSSAAIWVDSLQADIAARLLGKAVYEASEMADSPATGSKFLIFGDFNRYLIADRVGMTVEAIPHLFGANQRPTGQRGIYAYWRNGAKVIDANAFRALIGVV